VAGNASAGHVFPKQFEYGRVLNRFDAGFPSIRSRRSIRLQTPLITRASPLMKYPSKSGIGAWSHGSRY